MTYFIADFLFRYSVKIQPNYITFYLHGIMI